MAIWYEAFLDRIRPIEIVGTTEKMIILPNGRKRSKVGNYGMYFETWQEAKEFLVARTKGSLQAAENYLHAAQKQLEEVEQLTEPKK